MWVVLVAGVPTDSGALNSGGSVGAGVGASLGISLLSCSRVFIQVASSAVIALLQGELCDAPASGVLDRRPRLGPGVASSEVSIWTMLCAIKMEKKSVVLSKVSRETLAPHRKEKVCTSLLLLLLPALTLTLTCFAVRCLWVRCHRLLLSGKGAQPARQPASLPLQQVKKQVEALLDQRLGKLFSPWPGVCVCV